MSLATLRICEQSCSGALSSGTTQVERLVQFMQLVRSHPTCTMPIEQGQQEIFMVCAFLLTHQLDSL